MANVKISQLPGAGAALGTQEFEVNESGLSKKVTGSQLSTYVRGQVALGDLGITATASEINKLDGVTASTAELNLLDGVTASTSELNLLDGATIALADITATATELNYVDGVTSSIQTQLDAKYVAATQDTATWEAGSGTTESLVSPAKVRAAIDTVSAAKVWRSSDITSWTNGSTYTISHTLGVIPINVVYQFVCTVAHSGADVGDVVLLHGGERYSNWGIQTTNITSSNLTYSFYSSGILFRAKGSTGSLPRSPANWKLRIVATG